MYPLFVQKIIFPLQERLKGKATYTRLDELERSQWLPRQALSELQFRRLKHHLEFVYREVPYYRDLLDEHGLHPQRVNSLDDFSRIPLLTKDIIRREFERLQPNAKLGRVQRISTGGSTGAPVTVLVDRERSAFTDACRMRAHRWYGVDIGSREIVLWGSPIELNRQDYIRAFRDRLLNSRLLSAFDMGEESLTQYVRAVERYRPEQLYGYASAIFLLASFVKKKGHSLRALPKVIFVTAEPLFDFQRQVIEEVFRCPVSVEYGARDAGLMALECPGGGLHISAEGMFVEIDGADADGLGEIVVSNMYSFAMPIIRYRTGDVGALDPQPCSCERSLPCFKTVKGRQTDFLVTSDGRIVHALAIIYILRELPAVKEFQVVQDSVRQLVIRLVPEPSLSTEDRQAIKTKTKQILGDDVDIVIEEVGAIPPAPSGKFRYVVSRVAESYLRNMQ